ncbi:hypothetical protein [Paenibacillus sacheonensis]|uniref:DUF4878 domain-containing protein n=1 Tax=Paenibacillus sacheonensis TaxID=742054 RepID=A0A7X4YP03_9BACL|nr:hypothetical protein [Paenibacillus sacheonensis]MBM7567339.1 hypothetical protein [Paenibacillus sacheonensis]NBC69877.1 hypothetical protein [Paenibacillus sacheonensis]
MAVRRNRGNGTVLKLMLVAFVVIVIWMTWRNTASKLMGNDDEKQARAAVEQFYAYEQAGDFGSSWTLFHPLMQERFEKAGYIQKRAQIMLQDFGVKTFDVKIGPPKRLPQWKMSREAQPIANVYEIAVTESFQSPYGNFDIHQACFAAKVDGKWRLLWSYQQE